MESGFIPFPGQLVGTANVEDWGEHTGKEPVLRREAKRSIIDAGSARVLGPGSGEPMARSRGWNLEYPCADFTCGVLLRLMEIR